MFAGACLRKDVTVDQQAEKNEGDDDDIVFFTRHLLESANNLQDEMDKAKHELMESSLRAQKNIADLGDGKGEEAEIERSLDRARDAGASTQLDMHRHPRQDEGETPTATKEIMALLLAGAADLKRELGDARDEITRLRQILAGLDATPTVRAAKTHRRVSSDPATTYTAASATDNNTSSIPTVVQFARDVGAEDGLDDEVHEAYVANHMRISHGFVDNSWLERDKYGDDDGENECGEDVCLLGGLANLMKGGSKGKKKKDLLG